MSRILIVDDETGIRRSLAGILGDEGFETTPAADGEAAIESIANDGPPDLVLLDIACRAATGSTSWSRSPRAGRSCRS
jgi:two-component system nitrogen regulation response regulator NtrX